MSVVDLACSGRALSQKDESIQKIHQKINENDRFTIYEISDQTIVNWRSCPQILTDGLQMRHVAAMFVPRLVHTGSKTHSSEFEAGLKKSDKKNPNF
ncbi:hypothetical protein NPIL_408981 [Nephila pilipes]|uniref:Uncharacterized protein n=1 Tax=Nephila pilipes TaxID=299642 RepID=A0A8X6QUG1_NEPPI|nr:hypothetical protein NPIL_408981 [Nephila pilipes]